ncbi:MAG: hypothetical protein LC754_06150, partial [Acidobacteria bacterium]|nr:hypothetical protein [Acidobacteriota bacterium]
MTWTYLVPRNSAIVGTPTATSFSVTPGTGKLFIPGDAVVSNQECSILTVVGDVIALTKPLPFVPAVNDEVTQAVLDDKDKVRLFSGDT